MVWVPTVSEEVVKAAVPPDRGTVASTVAPSVKVTVPVGVPALLVTVAVNVTACPTLLGLSEDTSVVAVAFPPLTVSVAVATLPFPPSIEVTAEVVLFFRPAVVPVTLTWNVHTLFAASVAPDSLTPPLPAVAVMVPPPHDPLRPLGVATTRPAGRLSVKPTPVREAAPLGLAMVKLSDVVPPTGMVEAPNDLDIVGGDWVEFAVLAVAVLFPVFGSNWSLCEIVAVFVTAALVFF